MESPVVPDLEEQQDIQFLNSVLTRLDIPIDELWLHYISIGGTATERELKEHLQALISLPQFERTRLRWAAEELIADRPPFTGRNTAPPGR
jgi:hypothetical protein